MYRTHLLLLTFLVCLPQGLIADNKRSIAVIAGQSGLAQQVSRAVKKHISDNLPSPHVFDADNPFLQDNLKRLKPGLILTVGSRALEKMLAKQIGVPVLSVFIPRSSFKSILQQSDYQGEISVIYLDQPYARQLKLCKLLFPKKNKVGMLFGPTSEKRQRDILTMSEKMGLNLVSHTLANENELKVGLNKVIRSSDYLLLIADDRVVTNPNNAKFILQYAYVARVPVVGFSSSFVRAGGTAAIYSTPQQIGKQAAEVVNNSLNPDRLRRVGRVVLPEAQHPKYYKVKINTHAAYLLGVTGDEKRIQSELGAK